MKPLLVAFDTATERLALAVRGPRGARLHDGAGGALASGTLLPTLEAMMAEAGLAWPQVQAVAFGRGPGAFTGLRTACSAAQGLAFGIGCPVLPLDSLALVAEDARAHAAAGDAVFVAMDARMDEVYAAALVRAPGGWRTVDGPALLALPALHARWAAHPPACIAGSALEAFGPRLATGGARLVPRETARAEALLRLADDAWAAGAAVDPAEALPVYLRDKVALTTAEREDARRAAAGAGA